jgi:hypothetical protein
MRLQKLGESLFVVKFNLKLMHNSKIDRFALPVDCVVLYSGNPLALAVDTSPISELSRHSKYFYTYIVPTKSCVIR